MSESSNAKTPFVDNTKIGECAAQQPLSGINSIDESGSVNGNSAGGFIRVIKPEIIATPAR